MGTSANLAVIYQGKTLIKHTSYDGYADNVFPSVVAPIIAGGLDRLRQNFANMEFVEGDEDYDETEQALFRENAAAFIEACEANGREPYDLDGMMHYDYGIPDFSHSGAGLLYGAKQLNDSDFCHNAQDADFILDLDAGTLEMNYSEHWTIDLAALEDKDPDAVNDILREFEFNTPEEELAETKSTPYGEMRVSSPSQRAEFNKKLNDAVAKATAFDPDAAPTNAPRGPVAFGGGDVENGSQVSFRFHPDDFVLARLTAQSFQQAARAQQRPAIDELVANMKIERNANHCGVFFEQVPSEMTQIIGAVGDRLVANFGAVATTMHPSGGFSVRHPGGGYASSGWACSDGGMDPEPNEHAPNPSDLSAPLSFEQRIENREKWIDAVIAGTAEEGISANLSGERLVALTAIDPESLAQIARLPDGLIQMEADDYQWAANILSKLSQVEAIFNRENMAERWKAMPEDARSGLMTNFDALARRQFESSLGISRRSPRGP